MSDFDLVLAGQVVLPGETLPRGYVAIRGEKIVAVGAGPAPAARERHDFGEALVLPGAIDSQTHARSTRGVEDFDTMTRAAAAGGVTTVVDMPYDNGRLICNAERFGLKVAEAGALSRVDFALYGTVHPEEGDARIDELVAAGAAGFKFSTFGTDPERFPRIPPATLHDCFSRIAKHGLVAGVHNEDDETVRLLEARVRASGLQGYLAHGKSRPIYSENLAVATIYETGADTSCRAHVVHCSNGRGYELCAAYRQMGHAATIEACLHYLVLCEEDLARLGAFGKVNPPIRSAVEREKLWQHLAAGNITVVSTDHVSWPLERKNQTDFHANASGAPGLEVLYPLLLKGCAERGLPLGRAVQLLAQNPARLFNLTATKGALQVGCDADVVVMTPGTGVYDPGATGHSAATWSPYAGMTLPWQVAGTWLRGAAVFDGTRVAALPGHGRFVRPAPLATTARAAL